MSTAVVISFEFNLRIFLLILSTEEDPIFSFPINLKKK